MRALWEWVLNLVKEPRKAALSKQSRFSVMSNGSDQSIASAADQEARNRIAIWITLGGMIGVTILVSLLLF